MTAGRRAKVSLYGKELGFAYVQLDATYGATVGRDLFWPDGSVVTEAQLRAIAAAPLVPAVGGSTTIAWTAILEIPPNVTALQNLSTQGIVVAPAAGELATRQITSDDGTLVVTNPAGIAGDIDVALHPDILATINSAGLIYLSDSAPVDPVEGMVWGDTTDGTLYVRYDDTWVEFGNMGGGGSASMPAVMTRIAMRF